MGSTRVHGSRGAAGQRASLSLAWTAFVLALASGTACAPTPPAEARPCSPIAMQPAWRDSAPGGGSTPGARLRPDIARTAVEPLRLERVLSRNLALEASLPESLLALRIAAWRQFPVGERVARWAGLFASRQDNAYCFGPKQGGYVAESLLVQDHRFDCVLLFYRCTELARAASPRDAVIFALGTRFAGGESARVVHPSGSVDYDDPSHLDYSEDFFATGIWGRDVTCEVGDAVPDTLGTSRYPAGSRFYVPTSRIRLDRLRDGDLLFFVLNEAHEGARKLRDQYGLLVGHQGIVDVDGGEVFVIHAAASDLQGVYAGNRVVRVPLLTYLRRLDRFKGIMAARLEEGQEPGSRARAARTRGHHDSIRTR
jgi:hypothetical protein